MINSIGLSSSASSRNLSSKRRSKNHVSNFLRSNRLFIAIIVSLIFITLGHFLWISNCGLISNPLLDEITYFHVRSTARSLTKGISNDLRGAIESLEYPNTLQELNDREINKYFVHALLQLTLNSKGAFYKDHEHVNNEYLDDFSCKSRHERFSFHRNHINPPSPQFYALLYRYFEFHRNCTRELRNWNRPDLNGFQSGCKFVYLPAGDQGLGNKLLSLVSAVVYGLLTQRAILTDSDPFANLLCEPFPYSSWIIPFNASEVLVSNSISMEKYLSENRFSSIVSCHYGPSFSCENTQIKLREVQWLIIQSNVYFLPELFALPQFQSTLKEIFPNNKIFSTLSQWFLMPKDDVWQRINYLKRGYIMSNSDKIIGMHVRYLVYKDIEHYTNHKDHIPYMNERLDECTLKISEVLPYPKGKSSYHFTEEPIKSKGDKKITIFIASQFSDAHAQHLKSLYMDGGENGELVTVQHITATHQQLSSIEEHIQSFTEMWLLSSVDELLISSNSTFSYIAQGLGDHLPWVLNFWPDPTEYPACFRRFTSEPCHLNATLSPECRSTDRFNDDMPYEQLYPSLHTCRDRSNSLILFNYTSLY